MEKDNFNKAEFLYNIKVAHEKPMENPDDVTLSIYNMLAEIRELGFEEYRYLADVKLRPVNDKRIMAIFLKYYDEMDLFTKDSMIYKIHPKYFPEIIDIAIKEFLQLGPCDRRMLTGFDAVMSKGKISNGYIEKMLNLLEDANQYCALHSVRQRLCKSVPDKMFFIADQYSKGLLLVEAIRDYKYLPYGELLNSKLRNYEQITEEELNQIVLSQCYILNATNYKYYQELCTVERIRTDAKRIRRKFDK